MAAHSTPVTTAEDSTTESHPNATEERRNTMDTTTGTEAATRQQLIGQILQLEGDRLADVARFLNYVTTSAPERRSPRSSDGGTGRRRTKATTSSDESAA